MRLRMRELALRRYAERFDVPRVELVGGRARLTLEVGARMVVEGQREFGGLVSFDVPPEPEPRRMVELLTGLCICGRWPDECDCCEACGGRGHLSPDACWQCAGMGYIARELRG